MARDAMLIRLGQVVHDAFALEMRRQWTASAGLAIATIVADAWRGIVAGIFFLLFRFGGLGKLRAQLLCE